MGRNRKPAQVIEMEGKSHLSKQVLKERAENEAKIKPQSDSIECPDWVTDETAQTEYARISYELNRLNLLTNLDVNTLASYCVAYAGYVQATQQLQKEELLVEYTNKQGYTNIIENPLIRIQLKYSDEMKKHASEMGLTINARLKLIVPKKDDDKPKSKFAEFSE